MSNFAVDLPAYAYRKEAESRTEAALWKCVASLARVLQSDYRTSDCVVGLICMASLRSPKTAIQMIDRMKLKGRDNDLLRKRIRRIAAINDRLTRIKAIKPKREQT